MRNYLIFINCFLFCALLALSACSAENENGRSGSGGVGANGSAGSGGAGGAPPAGGTGGTSGFSWTSGSGGASGGTGGSSGGGGDGTAGSDPLPAGPLVMDECPGPVDAATVAALDAGGGVGTVSMLYPYDKTVFPGTIISPFLQWQSSSNTADAVLLELRSAEFEYRGCFGPLDAPRLQIPQHAWDAAFEKNLSATDLLTMELTVSSGGAVSGPATQTWSLAPGSLKGTVYYNTYDSPKANMNGAVMRISPGAVEPEVLLTMDGVAQPIPFGPCISCHSVSSHGGMLVASAHLYPYVPGGFNSASYDLQANPGLNPPFLVDQLDEAGFSAVYPDGSRVMTNGSPTDSTTGGQPFFPYGDHNVYAMVGPRVARLFDTRTGQQLSAPGWDGVVQYAKMPMFSPDGTKIVFNYHEDSQGHSLAVMDFDVSTNTFSNLQIIYTDPNGLFPGWPIFTPDNKQVIFALGDDNHFASCTLDPLGNTIGVYRSDLYIVDLQTLTPVHMEKAGGFMNGVSYLPQGARDEHLDFYPTMAPIASGGYFWLYFTSRRTFGNVTSHMDLLDRNTKKIWVAAVNIPGEEFSYGVDPSHPAFVLPGQEIDAGNMRAFPALEPCKQDGEPCQRGIDCCSGFCTDGICGLPPEEPPRCSELDEACTSDADCCDPEHKCIGGFCTLILIE